MEVDLLQAGASVLEVVVEDAEFVGEFGAEVVQDLGVPAVVFGVDAVQD